MALSSNAARLVRLLLKPPISLALRSGILLQDLIQLAKEIYVELGESELRTTTSKVNVSRLSVMTGVHRADVTKIFRDRMSIVDQTPPSLLAKVIATWSHSPKYRSTSSQPRVLSCDGAGSEFWKLVESISTTVNPGTVLFEIVRNGAAVRSRKGLKLVRQTVATGLYPEKAFELLSRDIQTLTQIVDENVRYQEAANHAHYRTEYDNIVVRNLPEIRSWIVERSREFHRELREYLSKHDADYALHESAEAGGSVVVTSFSHTKPSIEISVERRAK